MISSFSDTFVALKKNGVYFNLNELKHINIEKLTVERNTRFHLGKFAEVIAQFRKEHGHHFPTLKKTIF